MLILDDLVYILQQENYDGKRFLKFVYQNLQWNNLMKRKKLVITKKSLIILGISIVALLMITVLSISSFSFFRIIIIFLVVYFSLPLIIVMILWLLFPVDYLLKQKKTKKANAILKKCEKLKVIGITGSFGKTTLKNILLNILQEKFNVIKTPGNINTDIGIANFIIENQNKIQKADILIIEMGAYRQGEIAKISKMVNPEHSFLTGIGLSHLERFGSLKKIIKTKFELLQYTKQKCFLNGDNNYIKKYCRKNKLRKCSLISSGKIGNIKFLENFQGLEFEYQGEQFKTKLLARHNLVFILMGIVLARKLEMNMVEIKRGVEKIEPIKHRLEPIYNDKTKIWIIDDSYNGNYQGFLSGLDVLQRHSGRKVILTPGIVEQGKKSEQIHKKIGKKYSKKTDLVLLIDNSATRYIIKGMEEKNFKNYKIYKTTQDAHQDLPNVLQSGDVILFQNDLSDNY
ncbi:MAG TPA: UDP-N-acetylmuramoyl-tripeptide--D-alanyl-D-alanine ligase [Candidatus Moranbacteria bacterium]|nr:UDP-N-acetylmuramoyl-tripeptide--D-alanyl-D-alanine ligase [Candidatus Moranbacteria bacterium]